MIYEDIMDFLLMGFRYEINVRPFHENGGKN